MQTAVHWGVGLKGLGMQRRYAWMAAVIGLSWLAFGLSPQPTLAAPYMAATSGDLINSLFAANLSPDPDTIVLTADISLVNPIEQQVTYGDAGLPMITSDVTIEGQGHLLTRSSSLPFRFFHVASSGSLKLYNMTVSNGQATNGNVCGFACGGAIFNEGSVTVTNVMFTGNHADNGAALYNNSGTATISDSTFASNAASKNGGGIFIHAGTVAIRDSKFMGNDALGDGGAIYSANPLQRLLTISGSTFSSNTAANGGGIAGNVVVAQSTFANNSAINNGSSNNGGAIDITGSATAQISNSTFFGNSAINNGGALYHDSSMDNHVTVSSSTFYNNSATSGGGIYKTGNPTPKSAMTTVVNSIISFSTGGNCHIDNAFDGSKRNLADDGTCSNFSNVTALNPAQPLNLLSPADNGGTTQTIAVATPSPALDTADGTSCFLGVDAGGSSGVDQRGIARGVNLIPPHDYPSQGDCDVGAFEAGGVMHTLDFQFPTSNVVLGSDTAQIPLTLDRILDDAQAVTAYVWITGGTAVAGVDYVPFGVQAVTIAPNTTTGAAILHLLNSGATSDKTVILGFATQHGPGFSGAAHLGTHLTHTVTIKVSPKNVPPIRNGFVTHTPTLTWNPVSWASRYEVQTSTNSTFTNPTNYTLGSNTLSLILTTPLVDGTYFWRLRACSSTMCSAWTTAEPFVVDVP